MVSFPFLTLDLYSEAIYCVRIAQGYFFRLNPDEGVSNFPTGYFYPFIYAFLYILSFRNKDLFILFTYIFNSLIFLLTLFVVRGFYKKYFNEESKFPLILLVLSIPFTFSFY
ncbi:MAG: hypothetical protein ABIN73_03125, partial [candidate division WOR-3 bacterium]